MLLAAWPVLSEVYGICPWDVDKVSWAELEQYLIAIQEKANAAESASRAASRKNDP